MRVLKDMFESVLELGPMSQVGVHACVHAYASQAGHPQALACWAAGLWATGSAQEVCAWGQWKS